MVHAVAAVAACGGAERLPSVTPDATERRPDAPRADDAPTPVTGATSRALEPPLRVRYVGRVDTSDPTVARFAWSGTGVVARFSGTSVRVKLGGAAEYTVLIDGQLRPKLVSTGGTHVLAEGLPPGVHQVELYRRTEANQGESEFFGFDFGGGEALEPPPPRAKRLEIIGDSNTCGYGNEGEGPSCRFSPDTENHYLTYGAIAARELGAELSTLCWSGKGVVCNYGDGPTSCEEPMPVYLDRVLPERPTSFWDYSKYQPHAVVINLGANDISTKVDPTQAEFEFAYARLLERMRERYPSAWILATLGPMFPERVFLKTYIANAVQRRTEAGDQRVATLDLPASNPANGFGCDSHPSLRTHEDMAEALAAALRSRLGW